jgi:hypothetical protein
VDHRRATLADGRAGAGAGDDAGGLAPKIEKPRKALQGLVGGRTEAADRTVIAEAGRDRAFGHMQAKVEVLEKKVDGVYVKRVEGYFRKHAKKVAPTARAQAAADRAAKSAEKAKAAAEAKAAGAASGASRRGRA